MASNSKQNQTLAGVAGASVAAWLLAFTPTQEGLKLYGYLDPVGIATKCYGDTRAVVLGHRYSKEECKASLDGRLAEAAEGVIRCVPGAKTKPGPLSASIDFSYNAGVGAFCKSKMAKDFNQQAWGTGCKEFGKWIYAKGQVLPGLVTRREAEMKKCLEG